MSVWPQCYISWLRPRARSIGTRAHGIKESLLILERIPIVASIKFVFCALRREDCVYPEAVSGPIEAFIKHQIRREVKIGIYNVC